MHRRLFIFGAPLALAGCGAAEPVWAPDEQVARSVYRHPGPPSLTLYTVRNVGSDSGAHTGLMINASQRVMWDPAGTFKHDTFAERNDVIFGITPQIERIYRSYHARETYYIEIMDLDVSAETAERLLQLVMAYGAVPKAQCTISTTTILKQVPEFAHFRVSFFPEVLAEQFGALDGVRRSEFWEDDSGQNIETGAL